MTSGGTSEDKPYVYITRQLPAEAVNILREKYAIKVWDFQEPVPRHTLLEEVKGASGIMCTISDVIDQTVMDEAGPNLKVIASMTADASHIDTVACQARSIIIHTVPELMNDVTAEMTCCLLLVVARRLTEGQVAVLKGEWGLWKPMWICGQEFQGKTLGILGYGRVGSAVAKRMATFDLASIIYCDKIERPNAGEVGAFRVDMKELFTSSDFIVCSLPLTYETKGLIDMKKLSMCRSKCILVNTSRGAIVNHDDLLKALKTNVITGAGLDVCDPEPVPPSHPLLQLPNCVITPHMSTATTRTRLKMALSAARAVVEQVG